MTTPDARTSLTVVRVLRAASQLFASKGYDATTIEDIANKSGVTLSEASEIFPTPEKALQALLDHDLSAAYESAQLEAASDDKAVVRFFRYIAKDLAWVLSSPYDLMGIDRKDVITRAEFAPWHEMLTYLRAFRLDVIRQAIEEGDFMGVSPKFAQEAMTSIIMGTLEEHRGSSADDPQTQGVELATLAVRSLLKDVDSIESIRAAAGF